MTGAYTRESRSCGARAERDLGERDDVNKSLHRSEGNKLVPGKVSTVQPSDGAGSRASVKFPNYR